MTAMISTTTLTAHIEGIGLLGPGLTDWPSSQAVLGGQQPYQPQKTILPSPALLPAAERRRSGAIIKLTLATGLEAITAAGPGQLAQRVFRVWRRWGKLPCHLRDARFG